MAQDLLIIDMARTLTRHSATRQALITENVANADTPNYRAKDVQSFADVYHPPESTERDQGFHPYATRAGHTGSDDTRSGTAGLDQMETLFLSRMGAESPNGNTVAIEDQMARGAEVRANHEMALGIMSKSLAMIRMTLGRQG